MQTRRGPLENHRVTKSANILVRPEPTRTLVVRDLTSNAPASLPSSLPPNASCHAMRGAWPNRCALQPTGRARAIVAPRRTIVEGPRAKTERVPCPDLASMLASPREAMHRRYRRECRATGPLLFAERLMERFSPYTHLPWLALRLPIHPGQKQIFSTSIT